MDFEAPDSSSSGYSGLPTPVADLEPEPTPKRHGRGRGAGIAAVVIVVAVAAAVVASSASTPFETPIKVLTSAAGRTTSAGTAHSTGTIDMTIDGHTMHVADTTLDVDFGTHAVTMELVAAGALHESIRSVDGVTYMSIPIVQLPGGAHWISFSKADFKNEPNAAKSLGSADPSQGLAYLNAVKGDPTIVGRESLDGSPVTHYRFTLDLKDFFDQMQKFAQDQKISGPLAQLGDLESLIDLRAIPGEAWIDADGRVRRFEFSMHVETEGQSMTVAVDIRFSAFGAPVHVTAPDPSDTVAFKDDPTYFRQLADAASRLGSG